MGNLVNRSGSGKAFGKVNRSRLVHRANHPKLTSSLAARMIKFVTFVIDVLQAGKRAIIAVKRHNQSPVPGRPGAMHANTFSGKIRMI